MLKRIIVNFMIMYISAFNVWFFNNNKQQPFLLARKIYLAINCVSVFKYLINTEFSDNCKIYEIIF